MREAGQSKPPLQAPLLGGLDLGSEQVVEEVGVGGLSLLGDLQSRRQPLGRGLQLQVGEVRAQALVGRGLVHRATCAASA
jgi:hypothetical protein